MNPIFAAGLEVEGICRAAKLRFCFIGGLAVQRWGQPRMTADVDLTVITGFGSEQPYVDALLAALRGRIDDAKSFAMRYRTLLVVAKNGVHADISLGAMPFEERAVARASAFAIGGGSSLTTCSAEDLVVHKAFAARDKDWLDVQGIVVRQGAALERDQIWTELAPLLDLRDPDTSATVTRRLKAIFTGESRR